MTRKPTRNYSRSVVAPFFAILTLLIAAAMLAQTTGAGPPLGKPHVLFASRGADSVGGNPASRYRAMRRGLLMADPQTPQDFLPPVIYGTGGFSNNYSGASSVVVADVNGDNRPDLVAANICATLDCSGDGSVAVLLGNGDGTFQPANVYDSGGGAGAVAVAVADVNGDGKPDILVVNEGSPNVGVLLGNGDGTFQPTVNYGTDDNPVAVAVADVNGDGKPDIIVVALRSLDVLLGNGDGTFQPAVSYPAGGLGVALADVNGDGKPDIVIANGGIGVLLGNGDGTFQPVVNYGPPGSSSEALAVADVNGDGKLDVVVANCSLKLWDDCVDYKVDGSAGVFLGNGDGTFQAEVTYDSGALGASTIAVADMNGDGKLDLLVGNLCSPGCGTGGDVVMLLGNGDGTFEKAVEIGYDNDDPSIALADVNGDGKPDVLIATDDSTGSGDAVAVMLNNFYIGPRATKTVVSTSGSPSFVGQPVKFTAKVTSAKGTIPNGEMVTFYDGSIEIGTGAMVGGAATFTSSSLTGKTHTIRAAYAGDATFKPSAKWVKQVVEKYGTTIALSSNLNPSQLGQKVTLTAQVTSSGVMPTGIVKLRDGTTLLGSLRLSGGVATLTTSKLAVGTHPITAQYLGDADNTESTSPVLDQAVQ